MRSDQLTYTGELTVRVCWCGLRHAIPYELNREFEARGVHSLYCPLGHSYVPLGRTLPQRLDDARIRERALQDQLDAAERTRRALRGHLTRLRHRIANGVCPWCHRHFSQVERHVRSQHPEHTDQMDRAFQDAPTR